MTLIYSDPAAATLFWGTFLGFVLLDARLITNSLSGRAVPKGESVRGLVHRPIGLVWIIAAEVVGLAGARIGATVLPWRWALFAVGLALAWTGLALRFSAKRTLGKFFVGAVLIQQDHQVITDGVYAVIRHPGYAGSICSLAGFGIATANLLTILLLTAVPAVVFARTIETEEAVLVASLGRDYADYQRRTKRLLPRLW